MDIKDIIPLGFLVLGGGFVGTLLKSLFVMISGGKAIGDKDKLGQSLLKLFMLPLIFCALLIIFIIFVVVPNS